MKARRQLFNRIDADIQRLKALHRWKAVPATEVKTSGTGASPEISSGCSACAGKALPRPRRPASSMALSAIGETAQFDAMLQWRRQLSPSPLWRRRGAVSPRYRRAGSGGIVPVRHGWEISGNREQHHSVDRRG